MTNFFEPQQCFDPEKALSELISQEFRSKIEAKIALSEFMMKANSFGFRGMYDNVNIKKERRNRGKVYKVVN